MRCAPVDSVTHGAAVNPLGTKMPKVVHIYFFGDKNPLRALKYSPPALLMLKLMLENFTVTSHTVSWIISYCRQPG